MMNLRHMEVFHAIMRTGSVTAAARLFALLHEADASDARTIAIAPIPGSDGLSAAIRDRLRRAAAPR